MFKSQYADSRAVRTHHAIRVALGKLMCEKDFNDISVADIAATAGINRKTFYQYYSCREDIFDEVVDDLVHRYKHEMYEREGIDFSDIPDFYHRFYEFFSQQEPYVDQLICNPTYNVYRNRIISGCAEANQTNTDIMSVLSEDEQTLFRDYTVKNMITLYVQWVESGKTVSLDVLANFAYKMGFFGMSWIYRANQEALAEQAES